MTDTAAIDALVARLTNLANSVGAASFPAGTGLGDEPGLYSWWADDEGLTDLSAPFGVRLPPLIYAGQAGATSSRSGVERVATLHSRIGGNHLHGNIRSSTFRNTLTAVLFEPLELRLAGPHRLESASNAAISAWMCEHLRIAVAPYPNRANLAAVEDEVLARIDPPLNLMGMSATPVRSRVKELRRRLR
jgi:hypothetical protein